VPGIILAIGGFMVLNQLHIAPQIVTITYAGLIMLLVLAGGLAFGLGGRDVASEMLREAYDRGRANEDWRTARMQRQGRFGRSSTDPATTARPERPVATTAPASPMTPPPERGGPAGV
jgi:hypothetical protein